ncbi:uncharacterized protein LOC115730875 [Rhodamnia argentea]|uniref:Uncharacterized protein LOC115730875 n=1 Tax=Rhodamnia argentea TaxID=178133 RepID=A0ABM3H4T2_9MYRT|nr:uncharacterized protein LOC115730875 [Rhodamnia argentea]
MRNLQSSQLTVGVLNNTLTEATALMKKLDTPKASLAKIELLVFLAALLLTCLTIWGSSRRRHIHPVLNNVLWAAYTLSSYLITYTIGLMTESSFRNDLFPVWAVFLLIFFSSSDSFSAYSLEDNEQWKNYAWQYLITNFALATLLVVYASPSPMFTGVVYLLMIVQVKVSERATSLRMASGYGLQSTTKLIADYMSSEHLLPNEPDPNQSDPNMTNPMRGYKYVVIGEEERRLGWNPYKWREEQAQARVEELTRRKPLEITDEVITVEKVWACKGSLLSSTGGDQDGKLKDICLSFSLYKLLSLRFGGYSLPKEAHEKTWKLIQHGLLANENGLERAFRVVELELSFLFDLFYTNYPVIFYPGRRKRKLMVFYFLVIGSLSIILFCFTWHYLKKPLDVVQLATPGGLNIDILVTTVSLVVFLCLEFAQLHFMNISDWAKVSLLCQYVRETSWHGNERIEKKIGRICRKSREPWERKLGQYSLLKSHGYAPSWWLSNGFTATYIDPPRDGQQQSEPIELSSVVKKAVLDSLILNHEELKNGKASLTQNNGVQLLWACGLKTQTRVIFAWHIATSICEHEVDIPTSIGEDEEKIARSNFVIATNLSKYLAYLAAFSPKLLPDHPFDAECAFNQIIFDTRDLLKGGRVINQGARLGHELLQPKGEEGGSELIWKVLADFWAEPMAYVAPSDDIKTHAEHLAKGGEFVTRGRWPLMATLGDPSQS